MASYIVYYKSICGKPLLGGVMASKSSRFGTKEDAEMTKQRVVEMNGGEKSCQAEIKKIGNHPEIFPHCKGSISQSIGGHCFICKKILTIDDARAYKEEGNTEMTQQELQSEARVQAGFMFDRSQNPAYGVILQMTKNSLGEDDPNAPRLAAMIRSELNKLYEQFPQNKP